MNDIQISIKVKVTHQFLSDIMVGMAETCPEMVSWFGDDNTIIKRIPDGETWLEPLSVISIRGRYDRKIDSEGERGGRAFTINFESLKRGLTRVSDCSINSTLKGRILAAIANNDAGEIDSEAADILAQLTVLKEVIYG